MTPVTPESFAKWKSTRMNKKLAEEEAAKKVKDSQAAAGKSNGMSGRDLVSINFGMILAANLDCLTVHVQPRMVRGHRRRGGGLGSREVSKREGRRRSCCRRRAYSHVRAWSIAGDSSRCRGRLRPWVCFSQAATYPSGYPHVYQSRLLLKYHHECSQSSLI